MAITTGLGVLSALFWIGAIGGLLLAGFNSSRQRSTRPGVTLFIVGVVGGILLTVLSAGLVLVQPDERAVVFRQLGGGTSGLKDEPLTPGLKFIVPFVETAIHYPVRRQTISMVNEPDPGTPVSESLAAIRGISSDGQVILVDVTIVYAIDPAQVNNIHSNWRSGYEEGLIVPLTRSVVRDGIARFSAEEIYSGGRTELQLHAADELLPRFDAEGFLLADVLIRDVTFSVEFATAIEQKQIAEQEAQRAVFLVQEQQQEAERARVEAQGLADAEVIRAQGEAQAIILRATADAEGLRLINEQISQNPNLIQYRYIETLGDNIELVIIPSNSPFLFDIQSLTQTGLASSPPSTSAPVEVEVAPGQ